MALETVPVGGATHAEGGHHGGRFLIPGEASGEILFSDTPISFMMGVNAETGVVIDKHHPLLGSTVTGRILVLPRGRGSCAASGAVLELLHRGIAPAALLFRTLEEILTAGVLIAHTFFGKSIPVILIENDYAWNSLSHASHANITERGLAVGNERFLLGEPYPYRVATSPEDEKMLRGEDYSRAAQAAMRLIVEYASILGAKDLLDVSQAHIDACCYVGQTSLLLPRRILDLGGRVKVPSTCNSLNVDRQRWRALGADPTVSLLASEIGDVYLEMGVAMSFTCAPYLLDSKPKMGEQIGWGESNAVVFANSVLGARTQKYADYIDVMIALTGRAPAMGCHSLEGRRPRILIEVPRLDGFDDSLFPLLGYHIGAIVGPQIPMIHGLEHTKPGVPDLKGFGAGFATTSSAPIFHMRGVTPEAATVTVSDGLELLKVEISDLRTTWRQLNTATESAVDLVSLGNPHFSVEEFPRLSRLIENRTKRPGVEMIITMGRFVYAKGRESGYIDNLEKFGAKIITDTCWCMLSEPVIPCHARYIMSNSSKYAHYGPGVSGRMIHFGTMAGCVEAACTGQRSFQDMHPQWLFGGAN